MWAAFTGTRHVCLTLVYCLACRTRVAEEFRKGARKVLFSSDVSARGVDYPDVTMVVQVPLVAL